MPNAELEEELRKTHTRIATAQAELDHRPDTSDNNRQLFAGQSLTAAEPLIEPHVDAPEAVAAAPASAPVDPRLFDAMRSELSGLRELLEVQLGSLARISCRAASRNRPPSGAACSASACPGRSPASCWT